MSKLLTGTVSKTKTIVFGKKVFLKLKTSSESGNEKCGDEQVEVTKLIGVTLDC